MNDTRALIRLTFPVAAMLLLAGCCGRGNLLRPHPLEIAADAQGCPTSVETAEGYNCVNSAGEPGLCTHPGDWVKWTRAQSGGFEIQFTGFSGDAERPAADTNAERPEGTVEPGEEILGGRRNSNPIEEDCVLATTSQSLKCRISEDAAPGTYKYSVIVQDCEVLDPRIIIRRAR